MEPVCCCMSGSNCCFLTYIQVSHEAGQVVWYCHLFQNFPEFVVVHTVKGFGIVNKAEVDILLVIVICPDHPLKPFLKFAFKLFKNIAFYLAFSPGKSYVNGTV